MKRVVVTGLGALTPIGNTLPEFWEALKNGVSGSDLITRFNTEKFKTKSKDEIDENWIEIKRIFQTIEEWFSDRELYHKVGYLITTNTNIKDLLKEVKSKKKNEFKTFIDAEIQKKANVFEKKSMNGCNNINVTKLPMKANDMRYEEREFLSFGSDEIAPRSEA